MSKLDPDVYSRVKFNLTYLDWPIFVGYYLSEGKVRPFLGTGLNMGFLISGEIHDDPNKLLFGDTDVPYYTFDEFDFGLLAMAGVNFTLGVKSSFHFYIKYTDTNTDYILVRSNPARGGFGDGASNLNTKRVAAAISFTYSLGKK